MVMTQGDGSYCVPKRTETVFCIGTIILVNVNECRRHEFRLTAYTAERLFKSAVNFVREYRTQKEPSPLCFYTCDR